MPDEVLKLFAHDGPWALLGVVLIVLLYRTNERAASQTAVAMKDSAVAMNENTKALTALESAIDGLPERLRSVVLEMQRKQ